MWLTNPEKRLYVDRSEVLFEVAEDTMKLRIAALDAKPEPLDGPP